MLLQRSGALVFMRQIEGKPVEEVIAGNPDFFDIDESEHMEILYCLYRTPVYCTWNSNVVFSVKRIKLVICIFRGRAYPSAPQGR